MNNFSTQIAIIGGGISGLWLLNLLRSQGYEACLFEKDALGAQQTLASQGMIHGGLKYALGGFTTAASETIADMPNIWRRCLEGEGAVDLSGLRPLSDSYFLFSDGALSAKVTAFFASKTIEARISAIERGAYPEVFSSPAFKGSLYQLQDIVLDTPALLEKLAANYRKYIFKCAPEVLMSNGMISGLYLGEDRTIIADKYIFAAGAGNEQLIENTPLQSVKMQRRPVQQVMVKGNLPKIYAHAVSLMAGSKPRITFTSHPGSDQDTIWYLGGNLAEKGVDMSSDLLIDTAKSEISSLLPWIDLGNTQWKTLMIDRAEPALETKARPDLPFVEANKNCMVCWPTKLTLCPLLGDTVVKNLNMAPRNKSSELPPLPLAPIAKTPWELAFD